MNDTQRSEAVRLLGEGTTFAETWALIHASRADAENDYIAGKRDADNGVESELADFYRGAAAARARIRAELRAEARENAGGRAASDALSLLAAISSEEEPTAIAADADVRGSSPQLWVTDEIARLEAEGDSEEAERLKEINRRASAGLSALFHEMTKPKPVQVGS